MANLRLKLDLHIHSTYSHDSFNSIDVIHKRLNDLNFDGYALTDHDSIDGLNYACDESGDLVFIPALEISAKGCHIIALDPVEMVKPFLGMAETVDLIHDQGATAILAHPYGLPKSWVRIHEVRDSGFDAIEVANSAQIPYYYICEKNRRLAEKLGLPMTGGSDSHISDTIGRSYTIIESDSRDPDDVIKAIRLGRTSVGGSYTHITEWFSKNFIKKKW